MCGRCACAHALVRAHTRTRTHTRTHAHTHMHTHTHAHTHTHTYTHMHTHTYTHTHQVSVHKELLRLFNRHAQVRGHEPMIVHTTFALAKSTHDAISATSADHERREASELIWSLLSCNRSLLPYDRSLLPCNRSLLPCNRSFCV